MIAAAQLGPRSRLRFYQDTHSFSRVLFVPQPNNANRNTITNSIAAKFQSTTQVQGANYFVAELRVGRGQIFLQRFHRLLGWDDAQWQREVNDYQRQWWANYAPPDRQEVSHVG